MKKAKEVLYKYSEYFKESDEDIKIRDKYLSTASINNFICYNSSPRGLMLSGNLAQLLVLSKPDKKIIQSGIEDELSEAAIIKKFENDSEILNIIVRNDNNSNKEDYPEYFIIYRDLVTEEVDSMSIPIFNRLHPYFGFRFNINKELLDKLMVGDVVEKDTVMAWSNGYDPKTKHYSFGKTFNVAFMSLDDTAEDGIIISESAVKECEFKLYEKAEINVGEDSFLLNLYGDDKNYKPFPDIGETINDTGILCASREYDLNTFPGLFSIKDLQEPNIIFDNCVYLRGPGGKVVDIKVYYTNKKKKMLPLGTDTFIDKHREHLLTFNRRIVETYDKLNKDYQFTTKKDLVTGHDFNNSIVKAMNIVESNKPNSKIKKMYRKQPLDLYRIEFTVEYTLTPTTGYKFAGLHGDKGVVVKVEKSENMPVDKDGNRADMIFEPGSTVSRLNIGRLYERYISAASRKAKKLLTDNIKKILKVSKVTGKNIETSLSDKDIDDLFNKYVLEFVKLIDNDMYEIYSSGSLQDKRELIKQIVDEEFYLLIKNESEKKAYEMVLDIEDTIFKPTYGPVTYNINNKTVTTKNNVMIAPMYIIMLNKIADGLLTTSSSRLNHFGLPIGVSNNEKHRTPYRNNPVRFTGETETRLYSSYGSRKMLAELINRGVSVDTHEIIYHNILTAKQPTNIPKLVNRKIHPYKGHKALDTLESLFNSVGLEIIYTEDKNRFTKPIKSNSKNKETIDLDDLDLEGLEE